MGIVITSQSRMPGLNWEAPPGILDLEFVFDQVFSGEQRERLQLTMGSYRAAGPQYGIVDEQDPATASMGSGRPLVVQPNGSDLTTVDIGPGAAVTKSGHVIVLDSTTYGVPLATTAATTTEATTAQVNVVLLEYGVRDDTDTNVVTDYNTTEAVRRVTRPAFDAISFDLGSPTTYDQQHNGSTNLVKIVKLSTFQDPAQFPAARLNDVVVLALVKSIVNASPPPDIMLSVDMTRQQLPSCRPWFSAVDQQHRSLVGTGSPTVPHALGFNDLSAGALTLYQQALRHGIVLSRDLDVPGCPGTLCRELVDVVRVQTDGDGSVTGFTGRKFVTLATYPNRLLAVRYNKLNPSLEIVEDTSVTAKVIAAEMLPGTNVLVLGPGEIFDTTVGFSVYYVASEASRPPALPGDLPRVAGDVVTFGVPDATRELVVAGGRAWDSTPTTTATFATAGPIPRQYRVWLDRDRRYVVGPQVVSCAVLITTAGSAAQTPNFPLYGPARIRVGLWNAFLPVNPGLSVKVEVTGKDQDGAALIETVEFTASNWAQPNPVPTCPRDVDVPVTLATTAVFAQLDTWRVTDAQFAGANALLTVWADIGPTVTPALDDALPVAWIRWNGQSVCHVIDRRPVRRVLDQPAGQADMMARAFVQLAAIYDASPGLPERQLAGESFDDPQYCDHVLSRLDRHAAGLESLSFDDVISTPAFFQADGTGVGPGGWYYSRGLSISTSYGSVVMVLYGTASFERSGAFGQQVVVQYQTFDVSNIVVDAWTDASILGGNPLFRKVTIGGGRTKIRFRIAGRGVSGYSAIMRVP